MKRAKIHDNSYFWNRFLCQEVSVRFGYARVSKNEQSLDVQIQKLTAAVCDEIFQEKISEAKDDKSRSVFYRSINQDVEV
jgi:hypothetical protein